MSQLPLSGITVLDFSQFLSGPMATLKLADMGAKIIKVERKGVGDICRTLYLTNENIDDESMLFHAINRNKDSLEIDLKDPADIELIHGLIESADVLVQNFRPGILKKFGLDTQTITKQYPGLIYASVTGYGANKGSEYYSMPGQDLLAQSISGMTTNLQLNEQVRVQGLALADMMAGNHLGEGILAALFHKASTDKGCHIEVSLLESLIDGMSVEMTRYLNGSTLSSTTDKCRKVVAVGESNYLFESSQENVDKFLQENRAILEPQLDTQYIKAQPESEPKLLSALAALGIKYQKIEGWESLFQNSSLYRDQLVQEISLQSGRKILGTRSPIRMNGQIFKSNHPAPKIGEHNKKYKNL